MFRIYRYNNDQNGILTDSLRERALSILPENVKEHVLRSANREDRDHSLIVYLLLAFGLAEDFGIDELPCLEYLDSGKPVLTSSCLWHGHQLYCSFSHTGCACAAAVADFPVGIDIQEIDRLPEKRAVRHRAARRLFTEKICEKIKTSRDPEREFIRHFAIHEALYKQRSPQPLSGTVPR